MKRLSSYFVYLYPIGTLALLVNIIYIILKGEDKPFEYIAMIVISSLVYVFFVSKFKRVYYKDNSIYVYNIFSQKFRILTRENIDAIKLFAYNIPLTYLIFYYNENGQRRYILFIRNMFCKDFSNVINELN